MNNFEAPSEKAPSRIEGAPVEGLTPKDQKKLETAARNRADTMMDNEGRLALLAAQVRKEADEKLPKVPPRYERAAA